MDEIKREARDTATRAKNIREKYEAAAVKNAQNAAVGIATVYKNAFKKAQSVGGTWDIRSHEYATAGTQRKALAKEYEARANNFLSTKEYGESKRYLLQAQQAVKQAEGFDAQAQAAHEQATKIITGLNWYTYAEYAAAANALAANTPPDVAVPGLPALP